MDQKFAGPNPVAIVQFAGPISVVRFLSSFKLVCNRNGVHVGAALWLLHCFLKRPTAAALKDCIALPSKMHRRHKEFTVTSYRKVVNCLLETYATDDLIGKTDADIMRFPQESNKLPTEYAEALWKKALRCNRFYDESVLKGIFIEGLPSSIHHSMKS